MMPIGTVVREIGTLALAGLTAGSLTAFLTPMVRRVALRYRWVARPMGDRWGRRVVARLGGAAMFLGFVGAAALWVPWERSWAGLLVGSSLVFALGLVDDLHRLFPYTKLIMQLLIGCVMVIMGIRIELVEAAWLSIPLSVLWFVLIMNAFNLLDNMDGLAAGIGAIAAAFCALHAALAGQGTVAVLAIMVCGSCLGFLRHNFPPAKIYMGDSGSHFLGLSLATLSLLGTWHHSTQLLSVLAVPVLVLAVPIFDTLFVTVQRLRHGQHPFIGGRDHVSHRLAILGLSTRQTVIALGGVSAGLGALSVMLVRLNPLPALLIWLGVLVMVIWIGRYLAQVKVYHVEQPPRAAGAMPGGPAVAASATFIDTMLLHKRRVVEILTDFVIVSGAYVGAHLLRFEGYLGADRQQLLIQSLPIILVVKLACFVGCKLYRGVWRYAGVSDILIIFKAVTLSSILSAVALLYLWRFEGYSRSVFVIDWMFCFLAVGGSRVVERLLDEWIHAAAGRQVPVLMIGAGDTGERVLRNLRYGALADRRVVGFLDDDVRKWGASIHGTAVIGSRLRLPDLLKDHQIAEVLIAITDPPGELLEYVRQCCQPHGVRWKVVTAGVTETA